jgi:hypothetical protein
MRHDKIYAEKFILCNITVARHKNLFYTARRYCRRHYCRAPYMHATYHNRTLLSLKRAFCQVPFCRMPWRQRRSSFFAHSVFLPLTSTGFRDLGATPWGNFNKKLSFSISFYHYRSCSFIYWAQQLRDSAVFVWNAVSGNRNILWL